MFPVSPEGRHKIVLSFVEGTEIAFDKAVHERDQVSSKEFPEQVDVGGSRDGRPVLKFDGCLKSLPVGLSEMPDSTALTRFSHNSQRHIYFDEHVVR